MESMECPHCGAPVPAQRICCASCGSDIETGWRDSQEIDYSSIELPDDSLPSESTTEIQKARLRSIGILLAFFIAAPLSLFLFESPLRVLLAWLVLGLLLGVRRSL